MSTTKSVQRIVTEIHLCLVAVSKTRSKTYYYPLPFDNNGSDRFYLENMPIILADVKMLHPECNVSHALMAKGADGKLYNPSEIDDTTLPLIDDVLPYSFIVVHWV